jgi:hypothetical protein
MSSRRILFFASSVETGLRHRYLPTNQTIRFLLVFNAPSFGSTASTTPSLEYSDGMSSFVITLENSNMLSQHYLLGSIALKPVFKTDELMTNNLLQLIAKTTLLSAPNNKNLLKISLTFQNVGKSVIHIDPSYVFVLDSKSYVYGIVPGWNSTSGTLRSSSLIATDLDPGKSISGDVAVELPNGSTNLVFIYTGPDNSFLAKI